MGNFSRCGLILMVIVLFLTLQSPCRATSKLMPAEPGIVRVLEESLIMGFMEMAMKLEKPMQFTQEGVEKTLSRITTVESIRILTEGFVLGLREFGLSIKIDEYMIKKCCPKKSEYCPFFEVESKEGKSFTIEWCRGGEIGAIFSAKDGVKPFVADGTKAKIEGRTYFYNKNAWWRL
jgi:hypothetical protein